MNSNDKPVSAAALRLRAEALLRERAAASAGDLADMSPAATQQLLHELQTHQIELELQNEELRRTLAELDASRALYFELYDLAPVGYVTLRESGQIEQANLSTAALLGISRSSLIGQPFARFVVAEDADSFYRFTKQLFARGNVQACELRMCQQDGAQFWVRLEGIAAQDDVGAPQLRVVLRDVSQRKQAQATLARTVDLLERTSEMAKVGGWALDLRSMQLSWSRETCRIHEIDGNVAPAFDAAIHFYSPESRPTFLAAVHAGIAHGTPWDLELPLTTAKGRHIWVRTKGSAVLENGKTVALIGMFQDISDRKDIGSQQSFEQREKQALINSTQDLIWSVDRNYILLAANEAFFNNTKKYTGIDCNLGETVLNETAFAPELLAFWRGLYTQVLSGQAIQQEYFTAATENTADSWLELSLNPIVDGSEVVGIACFGRDITRRKQAEQALQASVEFSRNLIRSMQDGFAVIDVNGVQMDVNPALCAMTGFSVAELVGRAPPFAYWPAEEHARIQAAFSETLNGHFADFEMTFMRKNGERFPVIVSPSAVKNGDGATISFIATVKDVTALKSLQKQALHAQKMQAIGQLTGGIAHDFNNMLASIAGYTDLALDSLDPRRDSALAIYLNEVKTASQRARNLVSNMLAFSRGGGGKSEIQNVATASLIGEVLKLLRAVIPSSIEIVITTGPGAHLLRIDPVHLHQIIMNLCINARDAVGVHGVIEVGLARCAAISAVCSSCHHTIDGEFEEIIVRDNGTGIAPELIAHIFEPFFSTKEVGQGTGMGLSTVHGLVHGYGGHIIVTSAPGSGTTLRLLLPMAVASDLSVSSAVPQPAKPVAKGAGLRIMVVDDERSLAELVSVFLERRGYRAEIYSDSLAALEQFRAHPGRYAALVTDFTMPACNGFELAQAVLAVRADLPVILVSGNADMMDAGAIESIGVRRYFAKPINYPELLQVLDELLHA